MNKLQKKLERQRRQQDKLMNNYSVVQKSSTSRLSGFYKPTFVERIKIK